MIRVESSTTSSEISRTLCSDVFAEGKRDTPEHRACNNAKLTQPDLSDVGPLELIYFHNVSTAHRILEDDTVYDLPWDNPTTCNLLSIFNDAAEIASSAGLVLSYNLTNPDRYNSHPGNNALLYNNVQLCAYL